MNKYLFLSKLLLLAYVITFNIQYVNSQFALSNQLSMYKDHNGRCEPLNTDILELCRNIAYNETRFPNFMKQKTQEEAAADTRLYLPLIKINCSPVLKLFLCSLYAPPCVKNYTTTLKPCREMCQKAKSGCESTMQRLVGFNWPDYIDCWRFPSFHGADACVTDETYISQQEKINKYAISPLANKNSADHFLSSLNKEQQQLLFGSLEKLGTSSSFMGNNRNYLQFYAAAAAAAAASQSAARMRVKFACPPALQILGDNKNTYYLNVNEEIIPNCGMPCNNNIFKQSEIDFARKWVLAWSGICFASTLFTVLTFLVETSRFRYPERPIIFLSACYMFVALAYLIGSYLKKNRGNGGFFILFN